MATTATPDPDFAIPEQARPFQKAFNCLMEKMKLRVFPLLTTFGTWVVPATPKEDRRQTRLITASDWLIALMRIFSGDTKYMRPWTLPRWKPFGGRRSPQILAACGVKPSTSKSTEAPARTRPLSLHAQGLRHRPHRQDRHAPGPPLRHQEELRLLAALPHRNPRNPARLLLPQLRQAQPRQQRHHRAPASPHPRPNPPNPSAPASRPSTSASNPPPAVPTHQRHPPRPDPPAAPHSHALCMGAAR